MTAVEEGAGDAMKQFHRDNHYVPQFYLKRWAKDGKAPTYRVLVPNERCPLWKVQSLKGIAYRQHLYTYIAAGAETDEFERWLDREFEAAAEEAIALAVSGQRLAPLHWGRLARFAVAQDVRTPARLKEFLARQQNELPAMLDRTVERAAMHLATIAPSKVPLPAREATPGIQFPLKVAINQQPDGSSTLEATTVVGRRMWLWSVRHLLTETVKHLPDHRWTVVHAPPGIYWPTTDNPVVRLSYFGTDNYSFGAGWGVPNADVFLPLSPRHLLFTSVGRRPWPRGTELDPAIAHAIRR